ncbi:hypothetical protein RB653_005756 [Dictyostelium firmibasis]|uniref:Uncharacterized protein n=1 Tax=Dictyostelium firmibasis TaxID=79012 RepID=A0AAN7YT81_9MYCE
MALVLPIFAIENTLLVTENDLGRGFSIDDNGANAKKSNVFICNKDDITTVKSTNDSNKLTLINDQESLTSALNLSGELSLSYGLISGKIMGEYLDNSSSNSNKLTFLFTRRKVTKIVELKNTAKTTPELSTITNIDSLKSIYGLFYISKIEYGAILDLKITIESSDETAMKELKGELEGNVDINKLSIKVKGQMEKQDGSSKSKINVTSSVNMSGCKDLKQVHIQSLDDANKIIEKFEVDEEALVPVRMEISQITSILTPQITIDPIEFNHYKKKLSDVGKTFLEYQQMVTQLDVFKQLIQPMLEDETNAIYIEDLHPKVVEFISSLKKSQDTLIGFMQGSMKNILLNEIPVSDADAEAKKVEAKQMIGSSFTKTLEGRWKGPTINKIPTFKGTYQYKDGSEYEGLCLEGKRHGNGKMNYFDGNPDDFKSIDGEWKEDLISFPSSIIYSDETSVSIIGAKDLAQWKESHKKKLEEKK